MKKKKILATALSLVLSLGLLSGCNSSNSSAGEVFAPDYSDSNKQYTFWAYQSTYNGWYQVKGKDGIVRRWEAPEYAIPIENAETIKTYKDAGFNVLFITYTYQFDGPDFATSEAKQLMDIAHEQGLKCFVFERTLYQLSAKGESLIVDDPSKANGTTTFESQEALNAYIGTVIKDVVKHPAFYGFSLRDEPSYKEMISIGQIYRAIQANAPGCFVNQNVFPMPTQGSEVYAPKGSTMKPEAAFKIYLEHMAECTGAPYIQYDDYPLLGPLAGSEGVNAINSMHLLGLKTTAEFCKENKLAFNKVFQTCAFEKNKPVCRAPSKTDMYWQMNIGMSFGIKMFSYWTYYPVVNTAGEYYDVKTSFLDQYGNKNDMYYWMQEIHGEMQGMAKVLMHYEYQGIQVYNEGLLPGSSAFVENVQSDDTFKKVKDCSLQNDGSVLITELYDVGRGYYGYYITNVTDTLTQTTVTADVDFGDYSQVQIYDKGEKTDQKTNKGNYEFTLKPGEGVFVIPY